MVCERVTRTTLETRRRIRKCKEGSQHSFFHQMTTTKPFAIVRYGKHSQRVGHSKQATYVLRPP